MGAVEEGMVQACQVGSGAAADVADVGDTTDESVITCSEVADAVVDVDVVVPEDQPLQGELVEVGKKSVEIK